MEFIFGWTRWLGYDLKLYNGSRIDCHCSIVCYSIAYSCAIKLVFRLWVSERSYHTEFIVLWKQPSNLDFIVCTIGGKYQISRQQIQQAVQSLKASNGVGRLPEGMDMLGHFLDVSDISSHVSHAARLQPPAMQEEERQQVPGTQPSGTQPSGTQPSSTQPPGTQLSGTFSARDILQLQIEELNRQHAEAQQKLRLIQSHHFQVCVLYCL